ncbi:MAG: peptidylprolyl isomerase [Rhodospirillaceae bacterium]|nr:MAG: peptidylprolyl isomerase [Rhodospirillaceae bacterium]
MTRILKAIALVLFCASPALAAEPTPPTQMQIKELKIGTGDEATRYAEIDVHYTGWTLDGKKFDSSHDRGDPLRFKLGAGQVIKGWDVGFNGMRVGGKRELIIPPHMAYGAQGAGDAIGPNATLKFEIELISVSGPNFTNIDNAVLKDMMAKGVPVIDLRRQGEWNSTGIIKGSHMITAFDGKGRLQVDFLPKLEKIVGINDEVILICRTGNRTALISNALANNKGFTKIFNVQKGITSWIKEGGDVVKP